jgi:hypothetical protein
MAYVKRVDELYVAKLEEIRTSIAHLDAFIAICEEHNLAPIVIGEVELSRIKSNRDRMIKKINLVDGGVYENSRGLVGNRQVAEKEIKYYG